MHEAARCSECLDMDAGGYFGESGTYGKDPVVGELGSRERAPGLRGGG